MKQINLVFSIQYHPPKISLDVNVNVNIAKSEGNLNLQVYLDLSALDKFSLHDVVYITHKRNNRGGNFKRR